MVGIGGEIEAGVTLIEGIDGETTDDGDAAAFGLLLHVFIECVIVIHYKVTLVMEGSPNS